MGCPCDISKHSLHRVLQLAKLRNIPHSMRFLDARALCVYHPNQITPNQELLSTPDKLSHLTSKGTALLHLSAIPFLLLTHKGCKPVIQIYPALQLQPAQLQALQGLSSSILITTISSLCSNVAFSFLSTWQRAGFNPN